MLILNKIFFPFWNSSKHHFLLKKIWFRVLMILFIGGVIIAIPTIWINNVNLHYDKCIQSQARYLEGSPYYTGEFDSKTEYNISIGCNRDTYKAWTYPGIISPAIMQPLFIFYIGQFLFFIIGVNFMYLGSKKN